MSAALGRNIEIAIIKIGLIAGALDIHHMNGLHVRPAIVHSIECLASLAIIGVNNRSLGVAHRRTSHLGGGFVKLGTNGAPAVLVDLQPTGALRTGHPFVIHHANQVLVRRGVGLGHRVEALHNQILFVRAVLRHFPVALENLRIRVLALDILEMNRLDFVAAEIIALITRALAPQLPRGVAELLADRLRRELIGSNFAQRAPLPPDPHVDPALTRKLSLKVQNPQFALNEIDIVDLKSHKGAARLREALHIEALQGAALVLLKSFGDAHAEQPALDGHRLVRKGRRADTGFFGVDADPHRTQTPLFTVNLEQTVVGGVFEGGPEEVQLESALARKRLLNGFLGVQSVLLSEGRL